MGAVHEEGQYKAIVFVADAWGKFKGGIDVFNQKLCEAMGYIVEQSKIKVVCLVFDYVATDIQEKYEKRNIHVIQCVNESRKAQQLCRSAMREVEKQIGNVECVWIGHDIKTGKYAYELAKIRGEKCAVIFHTDYYETHQRKEELGKDDDSLEKSKAQYELAQKVNFVFCVGPMVDRRLNNISPNKRMMIIPGLEDERANMQNYGNIMVSGRFSNDTVLQKNWEGVFEAIGVALKEMRGFDRGRALCSATFYGFDAAMDEKSLGKIKSGAKDTIKKISGRDPLLHFKGFDSGRNKYLEEVAHSGVVVMGSETESFGLVAWEALGMGIPIVISRASGLYELLADKLGYLVNGLCGVFEPGNENSNQEMGKCIANILKSGNMKASTDILREQMSEYKWETLAISIAQKMGIKEVMDADIFQNHDCYDYIYTTRSLLLKELKHRIMHEKVKKRILFFGGISRNLFEDDDEFLLAILKLLSESEGNIDVYFCYETESALNKRISELGDIKEKNLDLQHKKLKMIENFKQRMEGIYVEMSLERETDKGFDDISSQIHMVPLVKSPSVFINILDDDWYFTLKYENRTSENTTLKITNDENGDREKRRLVDHMKFILKNNEKNDECMRLISEVDRWLGGTDYE